MTLPIQFHYEREVYHERIVQVEWRVVTLL